MYSVSLKEMCDFLTLKMLPMALALIKTKNRHLFDPLVKNCPFSMENEHFLTAMVAFLGLKNHTSPKDAFF